LLVGRASIDQETAVANTFATAPDNCVMVLQRTSGAMAKKATAKSKSPLPELRCFLTCDAVSPDPNSGKKSLYGLFDTVWGKEFPSGSRPFALFARLVGGKGKITVHLETTGTDGKPLDQGPLALEANFVSATGAELVVHFAGLEFSKPGVVRFVLKYDGAVIGWPCVIYVRKAGKK
jgi:hypothetical protein